MIFISIFNVVAIVIIIFIKTISIAIISKYKELFSRGKKYSTKQSGVEYYLTNVIMSKLNKIWHGMFVLLCTPKTKWRVDEC